MKRFITIAAVGLAIAMAVPAVEAAGRQGWGSYQAWEPDTTLDVTGGYMFLDAPGNDATKIYFNVVSAFDNGPNVNSGMLGSRLGSPTAPGFSFSGFEAELGTWADCNHDGYVGMADGAMREYRIEASQAAGFPIDTNICPLRVPVGNPPTEPLGTHNGGGWITEMLPIGYSRDFNDNPAPIGTDSRVVSDVTARVWGDPGLPGAGVAVASTPNPCASIFPNRDGTRSTTSWLGYLDCNGSGPHALWANVVGRDTTGTLAGIVPDPAPFYAPGGPAAMQTFGTDEACPGGGQQPCGSSSNSMVSGEQDCSQAPIRSTGDRPNQHPGQSGIRSPGNVQVNPAGTLPATLNETTEESIIDDCDSTDDGGRDFYGQIENAGDGTVTVEKHRTTNFGYRPWNTRWGCAGASAKICGQPQDAGLPGAYNPQGVGGNLWSSGAGVDFTAGTVHVDLTRQTVTPDAFPAIVWTFYAHVKPTAGTAPSAGARYAEIPCGGTIGPGAPPRNGWACDPILWNQDGGVYDTSRQFEVTAETTYQLRDVDCWDSRIMSADSEANPLQQDIGGRSVPGATDPTHGCP